MFKGKKLTTFQPRVGDRRTRYFGYKKMKMRPHTNEKGFTMHASFLLSVLLLGITADLVSSFTPISPICVARDQTVASACRAFLRASNPQVRTQAQLQNSPLGGLAMTATDEATTAPSSVEPGDSRIVERSLLRFKGEDMESSLSKIERFDDQIMGGISQSTIIRGTAQSGSFTEDVDCGVFGGVVRPQGGGFAGCRTKILQKPLDLSGNTGIYLKVAGDGKMSTALLSFPKVSLHL
eukprot:2509355-Rhodomonas_salina.1